MMDFIRGSIAGTTTEVPGIGPAAAKKLASGEGDEAITNTYQLIGKVRRTISVVFVCLLVCVKMRVQTVACFLPIGFYSIVHSTTIL